MYNRNCGNHHNKQVQENMYNRKYIKEKLDIAIYPLQAKKKRKCTIQSTSRRSLDIVIFSLQANTRYYVQQKMRQSP